MQKKALSTLGNEECRAGQIVGDTLSLESEKIVPHVPDREQISQMLVRSNTDCFTVVDGERKEI